jgi:N-acetylglucosaminyl-diphospho-decaprenol L-rhamnosyltransferase
VQIQGVKTARSSAKIHRVPAAPPAVSVIIVNYRTYEELSEGLQSLEPQIDGSVEVVVVDHATNGAAAEQLCDAFPWLRLIPLEDNRGFAAGVNCGAAATAGRYLLLLNPDAVAGAGLCRTLAAWMDGQADVAAAGPLILNGDGRVQASARRFPDATTALGGRSSWLTRALPANWFTRRNLVPAPADGPVDVDWISGACVMIRRSAFDQVGGMDEGFFLYWEDADLCRRLKEAGWRRIYHPGATVTHAGGRASLHASRRSLVAFHRSVFRYYWKHGGPAARAAAPLVYLGLQARLGLKLASLRLGRLAR